MSTAEFIPEFIMVPYSVLTDASISHAAKLAYGRLKFYAGEDGRAFPKHETLAREVCLKPRQLKNVLVELRAAGWIGWTRARTSCIYTVFSDRQEVAPQIGKKLPMRQARNCPSRQAINCLQKRSIENHHQKEKREKKSTELRAQDSAGSDTSKAKTKPFSQKVDDDETPKPKPLPEKERPTPRVPLQNPEMEFRARIAERHGRTLDVDVLLGHILRDLDCGPFSAFLEEDSKTTTAPRSLSNPIGHYRKLARAVTRRRRDEQMRISMGFPALDPVVHVRVPEEPWKPSHTCTCNDGLLSDGAYCDCGVGSLRRQCDEYAKKREEAEAKQSAAKETEAA